MTGSQLKLLALVTMLVDHIGAGLLPDFLFLRVVGRISMPIYAFMVAEGCRHTHNRWAYLRRLLVFAVISEIPFDLFLTDRWFFTWAQNIMFTFALGVLAILLFERYRQGLGAVFVIGLAMAANFLNTDYGAYGVLLVVAFYLWGSEPRGMFWSLGALTLVMWGFGLQTVAIAAAIPLSLYNGERGRDLRWVFYWFYPVHLLVLTYLSRWILT